MYYCSRIGSTLKILGRDKVCKDKRSAWGLIGFPNGIISGRNLYRLTIHFINAIQLHTPSKTRGMRMR